MRALRYAVALVLVAGCVGPSGVHRSVGYQNNALGYAQKFDREEIAALLKSHGAQPLFPN